jgi:hypothetical protein
MKINFKEDETMIGFRIKNYTIIVMDSSQPTVLSDIIMTVRKMTGEQYSGQVRCCKPEGRPRLMIIEFKAKKKTYNQIKEVIENKYPGLCVFDPQM